MGKRHSEKKLGTEEKVSRILDLHSTSSTIFVNFSPQFWYTHHRIHIGQLFHVSKIVSITVLSLYQHHNTNLYQAGFLAHKSMTVGIYRFEG